MDLASLKESLIYLLGSAALAFLVAPLFAAVLERFNITRRSDFDHTLRGDRQTKSGTPIMGGLLVILIVTLVTVLFNWSRKYTYVPIAAMGLSTLLGAADDLMNTFGGKRRLRSVHHTLTLIRVHKKWYMKIWHAITLPWITFQDLAGMLGSKQSRGVQAHEKLILQFVAGAITASWVYSRLGESWHTLNIPFDGHIYLGWLIIPLIIFFVMFTANAVNVTDGMDGLAGGSLIITFLGLWLVSWIENRTAFIPFNATIVGALLAYTYYNVKPARFQMGDVGSLGLGTLLAINAIALNKTLLLPLFGFIFYVEIFTVIAQVIGRRIFGQRVFKMAPLHHHYEIIGWSEERIVMRFWIIQAVAVIVAIWLALN